MAMVEQVNHQPHEPRKPILYADEVFRIQGAIYEVNREMGSGFLEAVYQECLSAEFRRREIPFAAQPALSLTYKGERLRQTYTPDFVCFGPSSSN